MTAGFARVARMLARTVVVAVAGAVLPFGASRAQSDQEPLIQIEVGDSLGLPLPDATVEVFALLDGGAFWEWVRVGPADLPAGINLLRFSHPGYTPSLFSVPLRDGSKVSLRVRLMAARDTTRKAEAPQAHEVHAIGLALEGKVKSDVIGRRRIIDRMAVEADETNRFGPFIHRVRSTELTVIPGSGGSFRVHSQGSGGRSNCPMIVMVNGDRRKVFSFAAFDQLYSTQEVEAVEVFPRGGWIPGAYEVPGSRCGMLVAWFRVL
jgi:hypothetical protein